MPNRGATTSLTAAALAATCFAATWRTATAALSLRPVVSLESAWAVLVRACRRGE